MIKKKVKFKNVLLRNENEIKTSKIYSLFNSPFSSDQTNQLNSITNFHHLPPDKHILSLSRIKMKKIIIIICNHLGRWFVSDFVISLGKEMKLTIIGINLGGWKEESS